MNFLFFRKTLLLSLVLTSALAFKTWQSLRSRVSARSSAATASGESVSLLSHLTASPKPISASEADGLLGKIWERLSTFTVNGRVQPEKVPVWMVLPFLENLSPVDLMFLLERTELEQNEPHRNALRRVLFEVSSTVEPEAALRAAAQWPSDFADPLIAPILSVWQSQNGDAARWFQQLTAKHPGEWKAARFAVGMADDTPSVFEKEEKPEPVPATLAAAWAETSRRNDELEPTIWNDHALAPVAAWAAASGQWEQAYQQLGSLPEHKQQTGRDGLIRAWAKQDWRGWLDWERAHPERRAPDSPYRFTNALSEVISGMQNRLRPDEPGDPAELAAFMDEYMIFVENLNTNNPARFQGMFLVERWATIDPEHASAWLNRQKPGALRDLAAETLAKATIGEEPQAAFAWAASIADPDRREAALVDGWKAWRKLEPAPADAWFDAHYPDIRASAARVEAKRAATSP